MNYIIKEFYYIDCPLGCSASIHPAKIAEHESTCPEAVMTCENSCFGCPCSAKNNKMIDHLQECEYYSCAGNQLGCYYHGSLANLKQHETSEARGVFPKEQVRLGLRPFA